MNMAQIVTYSTYVIFLALIIIGGKFKFRLRDYYDNPADVDAMKSLRGIAALGVILHHISQHNTFQQSQTIGLFLNAGAYFVAIFFFCSGYGLLKSFDKKPNYLKGFIKNRIGKGIALPFYVDILLYGLVFLITGVEMPVAQWICNILGLTMMNVYAWFPVVLILLYFTFYLVFKFIKNRPLAFAIIGAVIIAQGVFFCWNGHFAWWYGEENWWCNWGYHNDIWWREEKVLWFNGEWWVNSSIAFLVGMIVANKEDTIKKFFSKLYYLKAFILLVIFGALYTLSGFTQAKFGYWTEWSGNGPDIGKKLITYFTQFPQMIALVLLIYVILMKYRSINPITKFFGKFSLHTYLMNLLALDTAVLICNSQKVLKFKYFLPSYLIITIVLTVVFGVAEFYIVKGLSMILFRKKTDKPSK